MAVAASGGRDSTALLHATARSAAGLGIEVHALHVHHGLQPGADLWLRRLREQCRRWSGRGLPVHFHFVRLTGGPAPGDSVEAWARRERYRALAAMARASGCSLVLLAHHRRDQAETVLLQALRGAGPTGLAAMPRVVDRDGLRWARPWLDQPREAVEAYLRRHRLRWVDDDSNADPRFARNRLRAGFWPALGAAFGDAEVALAAVARRAQVAARALDELAAMDLAICGVGDALAIAPWRDLSEARRELVLRRWCEAVGAAATPQTLLGRLVRELPHVHASRWRVAGGELRLYDGLLRFEVGTTPRVAPASPPARSLDLSRPRRILLPDWGGELQVEAAAPGLPPDLLKRVELRARVGGERIVLEAHGVPRSLKKQFQSRRVPAWSRDGPLVWSGERLLFVPGLGIDARWRSDQPDALALRWQPASPVHRNA